MGCNPQEAGILAGTSGAAAVSACVCKCVSVRKEGGDRVRPKQGCVHANFNVCLWGYMWVPGVCAGQLVCVCAGLELVCTCISASLGGFVAATPG